MLWEHLVLNEFRARLAPSAIFYWRDKRGHEVDFVLTSRRREPLAIECKWRAERFERRGLAAFRRVYPEGQNFVIGHDVEGPFKRSEGNLTIFFHSLQTAITAIEKDVLTWRSTSE